MGSQPVPFEFKNTFDPKRDLLIPPPIKILRCSQTTWGWALWYRHHMTRHTQLPYATPARGTFWECWYDVELLQCTSSTSVITSRYLPIPASFLRPVSLSWGTPLGVAPRALHFIMIWMSIDFVHQDGLWWPSHTPSLPGSCSCKTLCILSAWGALLEPDFCTMDDAQSFDDCVNQPC